MKRLTSDTKHGLMIIAILTLFASVSTDAQQLLSLLPDSDMRSPLVENLRARQDVKKVTLTQLDKTVFNMPELTIMLDQDKSRTLQQKTYTRSGSNITWSGAASDDPTTATFRSSTTGTSGLISGRDGVYEIVPIDDTGVHAIVEYKPASFGTCETPEVSTSPLPPVNDEREELQRTSSEECVVRLLIAYTPGAQANTMDLYNRTMIDHVSLAIDLMNTSFANSLSSQRVELAHLYKTDDTESGNITEDINDLKGLDDGRWDEIHEIRDQYHADMVALITDGGYAGVCGRAYGFDYGSEEKMFQISEYDCIISNFTLAHEFGHLQGARHDIDGNQTPFPYGHGYSQGSSYRTIMAVCCGAPRVNFWSNPYVYYPGVGSMGTLNYNYNTLATQESFASVISHRSTPLTLATDDMLMPDHIATNSAPGEVHSSDTTAINGCLILESTNRIVLKPGFKAQDGALGTYRIISGCNQSESAIGNGAPIEPATESGVVAKTASKEKK